VLHLGEIFGRDEWLAIELFKVLQAKEQWAQGEEGDRRERKLAPDRGLGVAPTDSDDRADPLLKRRRRPSKILFLNDPRRTDSLSLGRKLSEAPFCCRDRHFGLHELHVDSACSVECVGDP
jgi:hypothetical protein